MKEKVKRKKCSCSIAFQSSDFGAWGVCSAVKEFLVCMSWACAWHIKNKSIVNLKLLSVMVVLKVSDFTNDDLGCGFSDWEYSICIIQNFFQTTYHIIMYKIIFYINIIYNKIILYIKYNCLDLYPILKGSHVFPNIPKIIGFRRLPQDHVIMSAMTVTSRPPWVSMETSCQKQRKQPKD